MPIPMRTVADPNGAEQYGPVLGGGARVRAVALQLAAAQRGQNAPVASPRNPVVPTPATTPAGQLITSSNSAPPVNQQSSAKPDAFSLPTWVWLAAAGVAVFMFSRGGR